MPQPKTSHDRPIVRLWPGLVAVGLQWTSRFVVPVLAPDFTMHAVLGSMAFALVFFLWWLFASRLPWMERVAGLVLAIGGLVATRPFLHESVNTAGMGMLFVIYALPGICLALLLWAFASRRLEGALRLATLALAVLVACGFWALLRTGGIYGGAGSELAWRWSPTAEERLLANEEALPSPAPVATETQATETQAAETQAAETQAATSEPAAEPSADEVVSTDTALGETPAATDDSVEVATTDTAADPSDSTPPAVEVSPPAVEVAEWPGYRGPHRDGAVPGVQIATDWSTAPPTEVWRRPVGPGWSSFAVQDDLFFTQEQRGDDEVVAAYRLASGEPVWRHRDPVRFWESNAGAGPRGTPTLHGGRVYALGATGLLNALDAATGARYWSQDVAADTETEAPDWGFSSSPLVLDDLVIAAAAGQLVAYDRLSGDLRWQGPEAGTGYVSPHLATFDGVEQILLADGDGLTSVDREGTTLWRHAWSGYPIVQPNFAPDGDVLFSVTDRSGLRRLAVSRTGDAWSAEERWTSIRLKPYFNGFVVHDDHAYGFDGGILACIDLAEGKRQWKGGRYGHGQLVLLPEQDLLLVLSEDGELVLVDAKPEGFREVAKAPAIEGKTWNHPVLVDDLLLVRNAAEMAAFRLER